MSATTDLARRRVDQLADALKAGAAAAAVAEDLREDLAAALYAQEKAEDSLAAERDATQILRWNAERWLDDRRRHALPGIPTPFALVEKHEDATAAEQMGAVIAAYQTTIGNLLNLVAPTGGGR